MKIGLFADSHYSTKAVSCTTRRPSLSGKKIREAMEAFRDVDLVVCLGDLVDHCESPCESAGKLQQTAELIRSYGKPFLCLRGNHDCDLFDRETFYRILGDACPPFSMKTDGKLLVFLDANYTRAGQAYRPGTVDWTDTCLPEDQMEGLKKALSDPEIEAAYVFMHQNIDPDVQHQHILANADRVRDILAASGKVKQVIQGHYHPGHDCTIDGTAYHTLPAMCEGERNHYEILEI